MPEDGAVSDEVRPTGRRNARLAQTVRDMVLSLVVVLAVVGLVMVITWSPQPEAVKRVDTAPMLAVATQQAGFPVVDPSTIEGLVPTSVRWEPTAASLGAPVWHVGGVYRDDAYLQVAQAASTEPELILEQTSAGQPIGTIDIDGQAWEQRESTDRRSLVRTDGGVVTIVSGTVPWDELPAVVRQLR